MKNLGQEELIIEMAALQLKGWQIKENAIQKTFLFKDFIEALEFINSCGEIAEKSNHHPDWRNVYNQVDVTLNTHETGGVTIKDLELASAMDQVFHQIKSI